MNRRIISRLMSAGLIGLVLLAPDTGDGAGGGGDAAAGAGGGGDAGTAGAGGGQGSQGGGDQGTAAGGADSQGNNDDAPAMVTMTQAEFDAQFAKRIGQARKGWEKELNEAAAAENQTAEQQAVARAEKAEKDAAAAVEQANRTLVKAAATAAAVAAGAKADRVDALLTLATDSLSDIDVTDGTPDAAAVKKAVESALNAYPEFKAAPAGANGASGGDMNQNGGTAKPTTMAEAIQQRIAAQSS